MRNVTQSIPAVTTPARAPRPLALFRRCIRDKHYSLRTEEAYVYWVRWFVRFHGLRHPAEMGVAEVQAFLSYLSDFERHEIIVRYGKGGMFSLDNGAS